MASQVAADIIINLFVLDQVCLVTGTVAAMNELLSNVLRASRVQAGQQGAGSGGPAGRRQKQSSCALYVLRRTRIMMYKYVPSQSGPKINCKSIYSIWKVALYDIIYDIMS